MKFSENIDNSSRNRGLHFCDDSDNYLDPGIFKEFFINALINYIGGVGHWSRSAVSECFSTFIEVNIQ